MRLAFAIAAASFLACVVTATCVQASPSVMTGQPIPGANQDNYKDTRSSKRRAAEEAREKAKADRDAAEAARKATQGAEPAEPQLPG